MRGHCAQWALERHLVVKQQYGIRPVKEGDKSLFGRERREEDFSRIKVKLLINFGIELYDTITRL